MQPGGGGLHSSLGLDGTTGAETEAFHFFGWEAVLSQKVQLKIKVENTLFV